MPKEFYTERDIEDLFHRGIRSLQVHENVVLTELAYETAGRLGLQLITDQADHPPAAPVRPYISEQQTRRPVETIHSAAPVVESPSKHVSPLAGPPPQQENDVESRIRSAVMARLGNQVDAKLLDTIIQRVVKSVGLK